MDRAAFFQKWQDQRAQHEARVLRLHRERGLTWEAARIRAQEDEAQEDLNAAHERNRRMEQERAIDRAGNPDVPANSSHAVPH